MVLTPEVLEEIRSLDEQTRPTKASAELDALRALAETPDYDKFSSKLGNRLALSIFDSLNWNQLALVTFVVIAAILCVILSGLSQMLSRSIAQDAEKRSTYECGFSPHDSATRAPFDVHYYVVGIMFLVFDVEIALIFPFASCAEELEWLAYANMAVFVLVLTVGYAYEWVRGALLWAVKLLPEVPANWNLNNSRW
jgi:NADH-quinone oxidoreductase subunit A